MRYEYAKDAADKLKTTLSPFAARIEIAGSVRRKRPVCNDIELVMIRKPSAWFELAGLFQGPEWAIKKGNPGGKYMQFARTPFSEKVDLFFAVPENWGLLYAIRTGSAAYSQFLAGRWVDRGFHSKDGILWKNGKPLYVREEEDLFKTVCLVWKPPEQREI